MDAKVISCILFVVITFELRNSSASIPGITVHTEDDHQKCTKKLVSCSMKIDDIPVMQRGEKGDRGIQGDMGLKGEKGEPGLPARDGEKGAEGGRGLAGMPGMNGEKGEPGKDGDMGLKGEKGELGLRGMPGNPGKNGEKGEPGQDGPRGSPGPVGTPGPVGPPGIPGRPGICPCEITIPEDGYIPEGVKEIGTKKSPLEATCKFAPPELKSGTYYMGPSAFIVYCNMTTKETCVRSGAKTGSHDYNKGKGTFWLSEVGVDVREIYNLTADQIEWLQAKSISVRQTLKYNCVNSVPYPKFNLSASVQLLTWNDVVIGPYPTSKSPFFYSVPSATDGCSEGSTEMQSTIIELQSSNANRLPITDLRIGDVRGINQDMSVESIDLCFG